jgi:putative membrane protein
MRLLLRLIVNIIAVGIAVWILPDSVFNMSGGFGGLILFTVILGVVNAFIGPIIRLLSRPITCITLGLFTFIINAILLLLTTWFTNLLFPGTVEIGGANWLQTLLWAAVIAVVISLISAVLSWFLPDDDRRR